MKPEGTSVVGVPVARAQEETSSAIRSRQLLAKLTIFLPSGAFRWWMTDMTAFGRCFSGKVGG